MKKLIKRIMLVFLSVVATLVFIVFLFMQRPDFGKLPAGKRLEAIKNSPNFKNGSFQNIHKTPDLTEGVTYYAVMKEFFFTKKVRIKPVDRIPSNKTYLASLDPHENVLIWFGHSSYFIQLDGKRILVDPVFSGHASPLWFTTPGFAGTDVYNTDEFPNIDYVFISHDHWDHLDYKTLTKLKTRIGKIICGLGIGAHLEYWGFAPEQIVERDWNSTIPLDSGFTAYTTPARHFSGRGFSRNKALWSSYVLETPSKRLYFGGDSGYDTHFAEIGKKFGGFDLAILENGQYDKSWKYIHMMPDQVLQASRDLGAKALFPVHSSKFALGNHAWDEPLKKITDLNQNVKQRLVTPVIGEKVNLSDPTQTFAQWWVGIN